MRLLRSSTRLRPSQFLVSAKHPQTHALIAVTRPDAEAARDAALVLREQGFVEIVTVRV